MYTILVHHPNRLKYLGPLGTISVHDFGLASFFESSQNIVMLTQSPIADSTRPTFSKWTMGNRLLLKLLLQPPTRSPPSEAADSSRKDEQRMASCPQSPQGNLSPSSSSQPYERDWFEWYRAQIDENSLSRYLCTELKIMYARCIHHTQNWKLLCWWESR